MNSAACPSPAPMLAKSILIVSDNYWIGGRETFLQDVVGRMRAIGVNSISLIAEQVNNASAATIFDHVIEVGKGKPAERWLTLVDQLIDNLSPNLIWAHHYSIVPSVLIAEKHNLPLHITLHGPLLSMGRYDYKNALGFALAMYAGATISGVSTEITKQITTFSDDIDCWGVFPNKVKVEQRAHKSELKKSWGKSDRLRLAVFSRQDKLEHLRQAVLLAHQFKRQGHSVTVDIYTGITENQGIANSKLSRFRRLEYLFGRKWLMRNPKVIPFTKYIYLHPLTPNVADAMQQTDVVLGMGRVTLEAIANFKIAILIGYEKAIGVVDLNSFIHYQSTNFSGRDQHAAVPEKIVIDTIKALNSDHQSLEELAKHVDIKSADTSLKSLLSYATQGSQIRLETEAVKQLLCDSTNTRNQNEHSCSLSVLKPHEYELFSALNNVNIQESSQ